MKNKIATQLQCATATCALPFKWLTWAQKTLPATLYTVEQQQSNKNETDGCLLKRNFQNGTKKKQGMCFQAMQDFPSVRTTCTL